jgi:CO dehydrogenase maturation factor
VVTAARTSALAAELGIPRVLALGNKARDEEDAAFLRRACGEEGIPLVGVLPYDPAVAEADREGMSSTPPAQVADALTRVVEELAALEV